jgi:hypothetical protein
MKKISRYLQNILAVLMLSFISASAFAQDKGVDINVDVNKKSNWYQQPWVWIVGGAIFILLLVALLRGSGSKNEA